MNPHLIKQSLAQLPHQQTIKGTKMKIKIQEWDQLTRLHHPRILISVKSNLGIPIAAKKYQLLDLTIIFGDWIMIIMMMMLETELIFQ